MAMGQRQGISWVGRSGDRVVARRGDEAAALRLGRVVSHILFAFRPKPVARRSRPGRGYTWPPCLSSQSLCTQGALTL